jgi:hypothetical protein
VKNIAVNNAPGKVAPKKTPTSKQASGTATPPAFDFETGETLAKPQPPVVWLCKEYGIVKGRPTVIAGYAGSIKTWLAIALALAVAAGQSTMWGGVPIQLSGRVRIIDYENLGEVSARRLQRVAKGLGIDLAALGDNIGRVALPSVYLTNEDRAYKELCAACVGIAVAIVDSLRAGCPDEDENSSTIRKYLDLLLRVTQVTGTIFIVIHHEGKAPTNGEQRNNVQRMRGSSGIADAIDCSISVAPLDGDLFEVSHGKRSWVRSGEPIVVRLVDEGAEEKTSGLSVGIRIEQVHDAQHRDDKFTRAMARIRQLLNFGNGTPLGYR